MSKVIVARNRVVESVHDALNTPEGYFFVHKLRGIDDRIIIPARGVTIGRYTFYAVNNFNEFAKLPTYVISKALRRMSTNGMTYI